MMTNIRTIQQCQYTQEKDNFKTVMIDKNGSRKMHDGFDGTRDLISYSAKYDENKNILLKIKTEKYDKEAFENDSSVVILMDFLKDNGSYLLPFNIRGATDHWWEVAYSIKNDKIITETSEDVPQLQNQELMKLKGINESEAETTIEIDIKKLKELGWCERFPLYIQILTHKGETITDSFNDPKPYENANFLVGAMPINKFLKYHSKCLEIHPH